MLKQSTLSKFFQVKTRKDNETGADNDHSSHNGKRFYYEEVDEDADQKFHDAQESFPVSDTFRKLPASFKNHSQQQQLKQNSSFYWKPQEDTTAKSQKRKFNHLSPKNSEETPEKFDRQFVQPRNGGIELSEEQKRVLHLVVNERENVFFTGAAGVGKSLLLREIIKQLRAAYPMNPSSVVVTASTGIAACNIGGSTLHSFAGVGLGIGKRGDLLNRIYRNKNARDRWQTTNVLIIDEISMVDGEFFDLLEHVARAVRRSQEPFGGIQVVLCGDFFQLPPVSQSGSPEKPFCFESPCWPKVIRKTVKLVQVFRQKDDSFVRVLNQLRINQLTPDSVQLLRSLSRPLLYHDGIEPTELFPLRAQVASANNARLMALDATNEKVFVCQDWYKKESEQLKKRIDVSFNGTEYLRLRIGAQVMLVTNLDPANGLANGSLGKVIGFEEKTDSPIVEFLIMQDGGGTSAKYVTVIRKNMWSIEEDETKIATREQIPLILAWAMSIHKSQGQTIQRLRVDLAKSFEKGHVYVALSRATCLEQLQILNFGPEKVKVHDKVVKFNERLEQVRLE